MIFMFFHVGKYTGLVPWIHHGLAVLSYHRTAETLSGGPDGRFAWDMMFFFCFMKPSTGFGWMNLYDAGFFLWSSKWSRGCFEGSIYRILMMKTSGRWNVGVCVKKRVRIFLGWKLSEATSPSSAKRKNLVGGFKYFLFSPLFGEDSHFD